MVGGPRIMRWWLTLVARRKSEELFVLNLLLVTLGLALGMLMSISKSKRLVQT